MQVAAIPVQVAIIVPQLSSFMPRRRVVPVVEIAMEFPALTRNPRFIVPNVAPVAPVVIFCKQRSRSQPDQQQNSSYHAFHIPFPFRSPLRSIPGLMPGIYTYPCKPGSRVRVARPPDTILYTQLIVVTVDPRDSSRLWHLGFGSTHLT